MEAINEQISRLFYLDPSGTVMDALAGIQPCSVYSWWDLVRYKDWQQSVFEKESPLPASSETTVQKANQTLDAIALRLRRAARGMDTSARGMLALWLTALEGIRLCNLAGFCVHTGKMDPPLADKMENWFRQYELQWRSSCHESELWRIRDVVFWYADLLRP